MKQGKYNVGLGYKYIPNLTRQEIILLATSEERNQKNYKILIFLLQFPQDIFVPDYVHSLSIFFLQENTAIPLPNILASLSPRSSFFIPKKWSFMSNKIFEKGNVCFCFFSFTPPEP